MKYYYSLSKENIPDEDTSKANIFRCIYLTVLKRMYLVKMSNKNISEDIVYKRIFFS